MPAFATIPADSGQKNGALEGAESRRGRTELSDFPLECLNHVFTTVRYDITMEELVP
jgi:hypothetical protein